MNFDTLRHLTLTYQLRVESDGKTPIVDAMTADKPLVFITGLRSMLPDFEANLQDLQDGQDFDFVIPAEKAYGVYDEAHVIDVPMSAFTDNEGKLDTDTVYLGATLQMLNEDGQHLMAVVREIAEDHIKMDFNHPLAGKDLHFTGTMLSNRPPKAPEVQDYLNSISGGGCGGCGGGCGEGGCGGSCGEGKCCSSCN